MHIGAKGLLSVCVCVCVCVCMCVCVCVYVCVDVQKAHIQLESEGRRLLGTPNETKYVQ